MPKKHPDQDRNFDGLTPRFRRNIYDTMKGRLRLAVLRRDLAEFLPPASALRVLDAGAGQGQWGLELAEQGHQVTLIDISSEMLAQARCQLESHPRADEFRTRVQFETCAIQNAGEMFAQPFDLVCCHAVMEWLNQPELLIQQLLPLLHKGGLLSLIFYNVHGLIFKNLLRTNYTKIIRQDFRGQKGSLTPSHPLDPDTVRHWLQEAGVEVLCQSGIRVFHDYVFDAVDRQRDLDVVVDLELRYSRVLPYRDLGRYIHILARVT